MSDHVTQKTTTEEIGDAVVALLSVGGYSLQRAWECLEGLRGNGLLDPAVVQSLSEGEVVRRLGASGYDRGAIVTTMMARRLVSLHEGVRRGAVRQACDHLREGRVTEAERALCSVSGVGPAVFKNFTALQSPKK